MLVEGSVGAFMKLLGSGRSLGLPLPTRLLYEHHHPLPPEHPWVHAQGWLLPLPAFPNPSPDAFAGAMACGKALPARGTTPSQGFFRCSVLLQGQVYPEGVCLWVPDADGEPGCGVERDGTDADCLYVINYAFSFPCNFSCFFPGCSETIDSSVFIFEYTGGFFWYPEFFIDLIKQLNGITLERR